MVVFSGHFFSVVLICLHTVFILFRVPFRNQMRVYF